MDPLPGILVPLVRPPLFHPSGGHFANQNLIMWVTGEKPWACIHIDLLLAGWCLEAGDGESSVGDWREVEGGGAPAVEVGWVGRERLE